VSATSQRRLLALDLPPGAAFVEALDAAWERGDAVLPIDPLAPFAAKRTVLDAMRPHAVIDGSGETAYADPAPLVDDVALVITTSGSTGVPKGAQLSHAALAASADATASRIGQSAGDRWLSCLPWQHIGGLQVLLRARLLDIPIEIHERFDVEAVATSAATLVSLVPAQLAQLLDAGADLSRFRVILLGGAAAPPTLLERSREAGAPVVTTYGMSETSGGCVYDGRPLDGVELSITDDSRIRVRGPVVMSGYRLRPGVSAGVLSDDGWLTTGDLGVIGDDGLLQVLGRADDVIVTGGENVVPNAVAAVLAGHPAVVEVVVTGVPDPTWGQRVVAVVVAAAGTPPSLAELRELCAVRLPRAAAPRALVAVDELPRLVSGKPDLLAVQQLAQATLAASQSATPGSRS
jgi:O-succinylbenzoic acid--CoA ligase